MTNFSFKLYQQILITSSLVLLSASFHPILAADMKSPGYVIKMGTINITGGNVKSPKKDIKVTTTLGQTAPDQYDSTGYRLLSGFAYLPSYEPFSFEIQPSTLNFGTLTANTFSSVKASLSVHGGGIPGYSIKAIEDHPQKITDGEAIIPDTTCDPSDKCSVNHAASWKEISSYGFGYSLDGERFAPFPDNSSNQNPVTIISHPNSPARPGDSASLTLKVNIPSTQVNGVYKNSIQFIALPAY